jgi:hypothetical protein
MPIQIPSMTNLHLISASIPLMISHKEMPTPISQEWTSLSNSRSLIHPTHSMTQRILSIQKQVTFTLRMTWMMPSLFVANWPLMLLLTLSHSGCQFCVHIFCVLVCRTYARFICWDHDGAIVTWRFNYIKHPHFLAGFFWHYDHLDRHRQDYDTSVSSATPEDIQQIQPFKSLLHDSNPVMILNLKTQTKHLKCLSSV